MSTRAFDKIARLGKIIIVNAEVAQLVEHAAENRGVSSPILLLGTSMANGIWRIADSEWIHLPYAIPAIRQPAEVA